MKRYLGPLLCVLSTAACSTNKPAETPPAGAQYSTPPVAATSDATPISDSRLAPVTAQNQSSTAVGSAAPGSTGDTTNGSAAATKDEKTLNANVAPDNTRVNERDRKSSAVTPLDQGEGASDLDITKRIRQAVVGDHSLSFTAKNVKIITRDGKVTLRGPVNTDKERAAIQAAAEKVAGANVDNQLEVKKVAP